MLCLFGDWRQKKKKSRNYSYMNFAGNTLEPCGGPLLFVSPLKYTSKKRKKKNTKEKSSPNKRYESVSTSLPGPHWSGKGINEQDPASCGTVASTAAYLPVFLIRRVLLSRDSRGGPHATVLPEDQNIPIQKMSAGLELSTSFPPLVNQWLCSAFSPQSTVQSAKQKQCRSFRWKLLVLLLARLPVWLLYLEHMEAWSILANLRKHEKSFRRNLLISGNNILMEEPHVSYCNGGEVKHHIQVRYFLKSISTNCTHFFIGVCE